MLNILTTNDPQEIFPVGAWEDIEFEVALDSGAVVHVCAPKDIRATASVSRRVASEARKS